MRGVILKFGAAAVCAVLIAACGREASVDNTAELAEIDQNTEDSPATAGDAGVNIDSLLERMEVGSRELYSAREAVVTAVGLRQGDVVADIGAGTGLYSLLFAEASGGAGHVYAVDIEPLFLDLINQRTDDAGLINITSVLGREHDITLPEASVDVAFIADTYHYFSDREAVMKSVFRALKPGGALILVDYDLQPGETRRADKDHVRFGKAGVISEIEFIGFTLAAGQDVDGLEDNYFVRFLKP